MALVFDYISQHFHAEESDHIDQYKRKCDYEIRKKFETKIDKNDISLPDDPNSTVAIDAVINDPGCAHITAEFNDISLLENKKNVNFCGPSLSSTFTIIFSNKINKEENDNKENKKEEKDKKENDKEENDKEENDKEERNYEREFGYIQTSKRFLERKFEKAIVYSEFHANLLHNQDHDEVLDSDGSNYPFYSSISSAKVDKSKILTKDIKFLDCPESTSSNKEFGHLLKYERFQQFFVYLVMRSKNVNGEFKYDVLFSFDWFIYLKWIKVTDKNNNIFEYNCGINEHTTNRELPKCVYINEFYTCNDDQFEYWIDLGNDPDRFKIHSYPKSIFQKDQTLLKIIKNDILKEKDIFENIKRYISNAREICEGSEHINLEEQNTEVTESTNLEENNEFIEKFRNIASEIEKLNVQIKESISSKEVNNKIISQNEYVNVFIKIMDLIDSQAIKTIDSMLSSLCKSMNYIDYESCDCIENTVLEGIENTVLEGIESKALPKMKFHKAVRNAVIVRNQERS